MSLITSRQHAMVRRCRALAAGQGEPGEVLLDGPHLIESALSARVPIDAILTHEGPVALLASARAAGVQIYEGNTGVLEAASPVRTPTGIVAIASWTPASPDRILNGAAGIVIGLVDVQDPGNVGAVIRSADAFGATGVLALGATADPAGWKAIRGAMGSTFRVPVGRGSLADALGFAAGHRYAVVATMAEGGEPLDRVTLTGPLLILLGNEGGGLSPAIRDKADAVITVPMRRAIDSLNVGVTAALVLWESWRRHQTNDGQPTLS